MAGAPGGAPPGGDPAAAGAPPADPAAGGAPPADPSADPNAQGQPTDDPAAIGDPAAPPKPISGEPVSPGAADTVMQIVERTLKAERDKGPKKPAAPGAPAGGAGDPAGQPNPVTGQPGFDPSMIQGPLKTAAAVIKRLPRC